MFARKHIYTAIRNLVFRENKIAEWDLYGSLGIWSEDTDVRVKNAYHMQQVIRYYQQILIFFMFHLPEFPSTVLFQSA